MRSAPYRIAFQTTRGPGEHVISLTSRDELDACVSASFLSLWSPNVDQS